MSNTETGATVAVWDALIRVMHWTLVVAFFTAYFTEDDLLTAHTWAGYVVGGIVVIRVVWGVVGPRHARFSDFLYSPAKIVRNLLDLFVPGGGRRYLGHTPAGGAMIIVLLIALAVTVWSGLEALALDKGQGPLAQSSSVPALVSESAGIASAQADEETRENGKGDKAREEFWEELHELAANVTLGLVILHILGVILASRAHHENLVRAMVTGRKRVNGEGH